MSAVIFNVSCPNCGKAIHAEVGGFCREGLNVRSKHCFACDTDYSVVFFTETVKGTELSDGTYRELKSRTKEARKKRSEDATQLRMKLVERRA